MKELVLQNVARQKPYYFFWKQCMDWMISVMVLICLLPFLLLVMVLIKLDSKGPVFFLQERIGKDGKPFMIIKFRTMHVDAEKDGPQWANKNDSRITRVGHYLRKFRIDEIPQLLNVIQGDMSIIGPRPERKYFIEKFEENLPDFRKRLYVKPGITGIAQTSGGYELTPEEKLKMDLHYIEKCSVSLDVKIVLKSVPVVLFAKDWR